MSAIVAIAPCHAQQQQLGRLLGVFDDATGQPVIGAEVIDLSTGTKALTSVSGAISLAFLEPGPTVLQIRKLGYKTRMLTVVVSPADTVSITLTLLPLGQNLPTVVTTAPAVSRKLESFEQRRQTGVGQFITTDQLEKAGDREMAGVMQLVAGPLIARAKGGGAAWIIGGRGTGSFERRCPSLNRYDAARGAGCACYAAVFLDGVMVYSGQDQEMLFDINSLSPREIAGIEYYSGPASMPTQFNGTRLTCGAVVIWTR